MNLKIMSKDAQKTKTKMEYYSNKDLREKIFVKKKHLGKQKIRIKKIVICVTREKGKIEVLSN